MGRIGSTEMNLIWENFGITEMCSGLIKITGSNPTAKFYSQGQNNLSRTLEVQTELFHLHI